MGGACDICGHFGWERLISTCSKCRIAREHRYCMRKFTFEYIDDWFCEECSVKPTEKIAAEPTDNNVRKPADAGPSSPRNLAGNSKCSADFLRLVPQWQKNPDRGKVKLISVEEVIRLSSGSPRMGCPSSTGGLRSLSRDSAAGSATQVTCGVKAMDSKSKFVNLEQNLSLHSKAMGPRHGALQISSKDIMQAMKQSAAEGKRAPIANSGQSCCREEEQGRVPAEVLKTYANAENRNDNRRRNIDAGAGAKSSGAGESGTSSFLHKLRQYRPYLPALHATWKGGFLDSASATPQIFYGGFLAQPPCRVHKKAYEFSKKMPMALEVELLPERNFLMDLFYNEIPDLSDAALYFFPDESIERSKQNYDCLFESMEIQNSLIRISIGGAELLIFTSKQLNEVSQSIIGIQKNTKNFLWGVFRRIKNSPRPFHPLGSACCDPTDVESQEVIDMDIDMEGGRILGNDHTKETSWMARGRSEEEIVVSNLLVKQTRIKDTTSEKAIELQCTSSKSPKKISNINIPPGFETMPKFKSRNTSSRATIPEEVFLEGSQTANLEKLGICLPPPKNFVKLNVAGISKGSPGKAGAAGIVRDEFGKWVFGYILNLGCTTSLSAEFWALFQGLKLVWERGYRRILVESANPEAIDGLKKDATLLMSNKSLIQRCKDMITKSWDCRACCIPTGQNSCTNWLVSRFEDNPFGLIIFDDPPHKLIPLLEWDRAISASTLPPQRRDNIQCCNTVQ